MAAQRGIQIPIIESLDDARNAIQMIGDYLNTGVDVVDKTGVEDHPLVQVPRLVKSDKMQIAAGTIDCEFTGTSVAALEYYIYLNLAGSVTVNPVATDIQINSYRFLTGNPRFTNDPVLFATYGPQNVANGTPAAIAPLVILPDPTGLPHNDWWIRLYSGSVWWAVGDTFSVNWLAIGQGKGEA